MNLEAFQLNGKNALVTSSHKGLGAATAMALANAGANVACAFAKGACLFSKSP